MKNFTVPRSSVQFCEREETNNDSVSDKNVPVRKGALDN